MSDLKFDLIGWISATYGDDEIRSTMGALSIRAGEGLSLPVTEVEDTIGQTIRKHIHVPLVSVATWLLANWWRLRWEGKPKSPTTDWRRVHCMSGIGGDAAWPALEIYSDGQSIRLYMRAEEQSNVSAIRYLRNVDVEVPAERFEAAVERLLDVVEARLSSLLPEYRLVSELRAELDEERGQPRVAREYRWQALAGIDPGDASDEWIHAANTLVEKAGSRAGDEIMGVVPDFGHDLRKADEAIEMLKRSSTTVDLSWAAPPATLTPWEPPWKMGVRLAQDVRKRHGLGTGPLNNSQLGDLLSASFSLWGQPAMRTPLSGGFRGGTDDGRTRILWTSPRPESQRFLVARVIGAAHVLTSEEHLLPVTHNASALQKIERAFAQEFLCPWDALDAFTDERGLDSDALLEAAEHFGVSDWVVRTTLVNKQKLSRDWLPMAE